MTTPQRNNERAAQLEAEALKARKRAEVKSQKQQAVGPPVESPALGPDGQVKKPRWEAHQICGDKITEPEMDALLQKPKPKQE